MHIIERSITNCKCLTKGEIDEYYPLPSEEEIVMMSLTYIKDKPHETCVRCRLKHNKQNDIYIEVCFYNELNYPVLGYKRFIIHKGYMMPEADETQFLDIIHNSYLTVDLGDFVAFQEAIRGIHPEMDVRAYNEREIGKYLDRLYFVLHRGNPREILYKASLDRLAFSLDSIEEYNMIGSSPEDILGMPLKLIRLLYDNDLITRFYREKTRIRECEIYAKCSHFIRKNEKTNKFQWQYLEESEQFSLKGDIAIRKDIYDILARCYSNSLYEELRRFCVLSEYLGKYSPYTKLPKDIDDIYMECSKLRRIYSCLEDRYKINEGIRQHSAPDKYNYEDDEYRVIAPTSVLEIIEEANAQNNCLMNYVEAAASGRSNILFIRKKGIKSSYITMEIRDNRIIQARCRFNRTPEPQDVDFIKKYADSHGVIFDCNVIDNIDPDEFWDDQDE